MDRANAARASASPAVEQGPQHSPKPPSNQKPAEPETTAVGSQSLQVLAQQINNNANGRTAQVSNAGPKENMEGKDSREQPAQDDAAGGLVKRPRAEGTEPDGASPKRRARKGDPKRTSVVYKSGFKSQFEVCPNPASFNDGY